MIDRGANPFIVDYAGRTRFKLGRLSNLPTKKSIYFTIAEFGDTTGLPDPWFYQTGVFDGKFDSMIGQGASGVVISGRWQGKRAAFKFVQIENRKVIQDSLRSLNEKLSEMTSIQSVRGSNIVSFYGHYR